MSHQANASDGNPAILLASRKAKGLPRAVLAERSAGLYISVMLLRERKTLSAGFIVPCLPSDTAKPPAAGQWVHEIKLDGFRLLAIRDACGVRLLTRHGTDWTDHFPNVHAAVSKLRCRSCLSDGEVGAPDDRGIPCFDRLIEIDGVDIRRNPIEERKRALAKLLRGATGAGIMFCDHIEGDARRDPKCERRTYLQEAPRPDIRVPSLQRHR